jgi:hypothetical protein
LRVLAVIAHAGFARNLESVFAELAGRGHDVMIVLERARDGSARERCLDRLLASHPERIRVVPSRQPAEGTWAETGVSLRTAIDYSRYLEPGYAKATRARARGRSRIPVVFARLFESPVRGALVRLLERCQRSLPPWPEADELIRTHHPDLVVLSPLVEVGSPQIDYQRAARRRSVPSALVAGSWDLLTIKGGILEPPELVAVWNEAMAAEARDLHGVPPDRIAVTGAHTFDHWRTWKPATSREEFCRSRGLAPERPYVLYVGSSSFLAPDEGRSVEKWARALRAHEDPRLSELGIIYRPHPTNAPPDSRMDGSQVVVLPPGGVDPQDAEDRAEYFDSIYHSAAVVGVNTSAFLEAALVGRPTLAWVHDYPDSQRGTLHFQHLLVENGGILQTAETFPDHARQLREAVSRGMAGPNADAFVHSFLSPASSNGSSAASAVVDALDAVGGMSPAPVADRTSSRPGKPGAFLWAMRSALALRGPLRRLLAAARRR